MLTYLDDLDNSIINEMRDWMLDCCMDDDDIEVVNDLSHIEIQHYIQEEFDGGIDAFLGYDI